MSVRGIVKCFPTKIINSNDLVGSGPDGLGNDVCPDGFIHLGRQCYKRRTTLSRGTRDRAEEDCQGDEMMYVPKDSEQNVIFKKFLETVTLTAS